LPYPLHYPFALPAWDIDVIIRRTLVYGLLTSALLILYFSLVVGLQAIFQAITGEQRSPVATVLSTLAIAALFSPLRRRIQDNIDRRFYRRKYDAEKILSAFGASLREEVDLDQVHSRLLAIVQETMQPETASLWLKKPPKSTRAGLNLMIRIEYQSLSELQPAGTICN
jgi:hypothetical protein